MLEKEAVDALSLDGKTHAPYGVPALMIQVEFTAARGATNVELGLSRVQTTCMTHAEFAEGYKQDNPDFVLIVNAARRIARRKGLPDPLLDNLAENTVMAHMVEGNEGGASKLQSVHWPFLRRVCTNKAYESWPIELDRAVFTKLGIAMYDHQPNKHKPLGLKRYTHVTSPLRRFADLVNHANIQAYLEGKEPPYGSKDLKEIAAELTAMYIQRSYVFARTKKQLQKQATQAA
jgi:RNB domain